VDEVVVLPSSLDGLQMQLDDLEKFYDLQQLIVNFGKNKIMVFNATKEAFSLEGQEVEIIIACSYSG
jgi:hypothetical protein